MMMLFSLYMSKDKKIPESKAAQKVENISLRPFAKADLSRVLEIERISFLSPWKEEFFISESRNPHSCFLVAEKKEEVLGYICCWFIAEEGQILNIAVHPDSRQSGLGKLLVQEILKEAKKKGVDSLSLEVRKSNIAALSLYKELGFYETTIRRKYYENGEDALLMVCRVF
jgi:ribosomal-protein-alanine N-acetyltransferase